MIKTRTTLSKCVRKCLLNRGKTQKWLIEEVRNETGLYFDRSYLSKILRGKSKNPKILSAMEKILGFRIVKDLDLSVEEVTKAALASGWTLTPD